MGVRFLKIAVIYFLAGIIMGMYISITQSFQYAPSHAHVNLLGWASLALVGIIYHLFPRAAENYFAKIHFWLHNIGLPIMMIGLVWLESGSLSFEPLIVIGASLTSIGILLFVINVLINVKAGSSQSNDLKRNIAG